MKGKGSFWILLVLSGSLLACNGADVGPNASADTGTQVADNTSDAAQQEMLSNQQTLVSTVGGTVGVEAGYLSDGATITLPTGFAIGSCVMTAAPAFIDGSALSVRAMVNTATGVITCKKVVKERDQVPATEEGCVASYTVICTN